MDDLKRSILGYDISTGKGSGNIYYYSNFIMMDDKNPGCGCICSPVGIGSNAKGVFLDKIYVSVADLPFEMIEHVLEEVHR